MDPVKLYLLGLGDGLLTYLRDDFPGFKWFILDEVSYILDGLLFIDYFALEDDNVFSNTDFSLYELLK